MFLVGRRGFHSPRSNGSCGRSMSQVRGRGRVCRIPGEHCCLHDYCCLCSYFGNRNTSYSHTTYAFHITETVASLYILQCLLFLICLNKYVKSVLGPL